MDPTLVRHIYDIHEINRISPATLEDHGVISMLMRNAMEKDALDFMHQHPEFTDNPVAELKWAMAEAGSNPDIGDAYLRFMKVMVYGDQKPDFEFALKVFDRLLSIACAPHSDLSFYDERQARQTKMASAKVASRGPGLGM